VPLPSVTKNISPHFHSCLLFFQTKFGYEKHFKQHESIVPEFCFIFEALTFTCVNASIKV